MMFAISELKSLRETKRDFEKQFITHVLRNCNWSMPQAAERLGIERPNLYRKVKALKIFKTEEV